MYNDKTYKEQQKISLIVPCYNEEAALPIFYQEVTAVMEKLPVRYEVILVNDGSEDGTLPLMKQLAQVDRHIKYLSFSRNFGKEAAMYAGFCNADGVIIQTYRRMGIEERTCLLQIVKFLMNSSELRKYKVENESSVES